MRRCIHRWFAALLFMAAWGGLSGQQTGGCITFGDVVGTGVHPLPTGWNYVPHPSVSYQSAYLYRSGSMEYMLLYFSRGGRTFFIMPDFDLVNPQGWYFQFYYYGHENGTLELGWIEHGMDTGSFHAVEQIAMTPRQWMFNSVGLASVPSGGKRLAFAVRCENFGSSSLTLENMEITQNPGVVRDFRVERNDEDSIVFAWEQMGDVETYMNVVNVDDGLSVSYSNLPAGRFAIARQSGTVYKAYLTGYPSLNAVICGPEWEYMGSALVPALDYSECVDIGKRYSNRSTPYLGKFSNPYQTAGLVVDNSNASAMRHVVNTDTAEFDPNVGPALRVIPPGETMSMRLGNWNTGAEAEAMVYKIPVDTTRADMLILKYAAVMEDPDHDAASQPRFRIEILDANGIQIEPASCNSYDFVASPSLGWNTILGESPLSSTVLWKDWTIVGIDISAYHGQTIMVRLTTFDCSQGAHYGYAYYTLECAIKNIQFLSCSLDDSNHVAAPEGFTYSWHRDDSPTIVGHEREVKLPVDNHTYYCDLGFIGNPSCSVTMNVLSRRVSPVARLSYQVEREDCRFKVSFRNRSYLSDDTLNRGRYTRWVFDGRQVVEQDDPVVWWDMSGTHRAVLYSALDEDFLCADSATCTFGLDFAHGSQRRTICRGDTLHFADTVLATPGLYRLMPHCDTVTMLRLVVLDTTLTECTVEQCVSYTFKDSTFFASGDYRIVYPNTVGCDSTFILHLTLYPEYVCGDTLRFCAPGPYIYHGVAYDTPRTIDTLLHTVHGCDSLVGVVLETQDSLFRVAAHHSIDGQHWTDTVPIIICSNQMLHLRDMTEGGADAWRWTLAFGGNDSMLATSQRCVLAPPEAGRYDIGLEVTSLHGCHDSLLWPLVVLPSPEAGFAWTPLLYDRKPETQFLNYTVPADCEYEWWVQREPGVAGVDTLFDFEPYYRWLGDWPRGEVEVSLQAAYQLVMDSVVHRCVDTVVHTVKIHGCFLQFPNLVTPNGDGINDRWEVVGLLEQGLYSMSELWIYDAWGAEVYHARDIVRGEQFWNPDGRPDGSYYYRFMAQGPCGLVRHSGLIEVVR